MKIYSKVVINIKTGEIVSEESEEYFGPISECGGSDSSSDDTVYNARMADLSEEQQEWSGEMLNHYKYGVDYDPTESVSGYYDDSGAFVESKSIVKDDYDTLTEYMAAIASQVAYQKEAAGKEIVTITQGELNNYDPDAYISEMDLADKEIADAFGLTDDETAALRSSLSLETTQNTASEALVAPTTELAQSQIEAAQTVLPGATEATTSGNTLTTAENTASLGLVQPSAELAQAQIEAAMAENTASLGLIQPSADLEAANISESQAQISARAPIMSEYYNTVGEGVNVNDRMNEASADVAQASGAQMDSLSKNVALRGGNISSGYGRSMMSDLTSDTMKADAFARTSARRTAETENLENMRSALTLGDI